MDILFSVGLLIFLGYSLFKANSIRELNKSKSKAVIQCETAIDAASKLKGTLSSYVQNSEGRGLAAIKLLEESVKIEAEKELQTQMVLWQEWKIKRTAVLKQEKAEDEKALGENVIKLHG